MTAPTALRVQEAGQSRDRPVRVLHVLGGLNRGGVETWLMHLLRQVDRRRFRTAFLVHTREACPYDAEARELGADLIACPFPRRPIRYARDLRRTLHEQGPYDVVHSHVHHFSGFVLRTAAKAGVPIRIAHSHNDAPNESWNIPRRVYKLVMKRLIARHATNLLAASELAAAALFGRDWQADPRGSVIYYGLDLSPFRQPVDGAALRTALGLPGDAIVVGHVGSFKAQKNHQKVLSVFSEVRRREPGSRLLLVGDGPLRPAVERQVAALRLNNSVVFAGLRGDVARLMLGVMDAFVFPSLWEGLGLVLVEAQAAGLPCVVSSVVPREATVVESLVARLPCSADDAAWAEALLRAAGKRRDFRAGFDAVESSRFNLRNCVRHLEAVYSRDLQDRFFGQPAAEASESGGFKNRVGAK